MKTIAKHYSKSGKLGLVQFETLEGEGLSFQVAGPAIEKDNLVIKELGEEGSVNTLLAINTGNHYYLLSDMDLLKGAKQNRTVNTSVLIAPGAKQEIPVSCVERSRWDFTSPDFKPGNEVMDPKMRSSKAAWLREDSKGRSAITQSKVWDMIQDEISAARIESKTEDYGELLSNRDKVREEQKLILPPFEIREGMNGLALFQGKNLAFFDVFGNRDAYRYYFEKLTSSAISLAGEGAAINEYEAFYRLSERLDDFLHNLDKNYDPKAGGAGELRWSGLKEYPGFELGHNDRLAHLAASFTD